MVMEWVYRCSNLHVKMTRMEKKSVCSMIIITFFYDSLAFMREKLYFCRKIAIIMEIIDDNIMPGNLCRESFVARS